MISEMRQLSIISFHVAQTYQVCKRIEFLAHQGRLLPPSSYLPIHEIEEEAEGHESKSSPEVAIVICFTQAVSHRRQYGHDWS